MTTLITQGSRLACADQTFDKGVESGIVSAGGRLDGRWDYYQLNWDNKGRIYIDRSSGKSLKVGDRVRVGPWSGGSSYCSIDLLSNESTTGEQPMNGKLYKGVVVMTTQVACAGGATSVPKSSIVYESPTFLATTDDLARGIIIAEALKGNPSLDFNDPCNVLEVQFVVKV